jgi:copper(I)-binding protein
MKRRLVPIIFFALFSMNSFAEVIVKDAWVRATAPGQKVAAAYMQLTSSTDVKLIELHSTIASTVAVHEMTMTGDVMKMRQLKSLDLPAGKLVELRPGGYHIMLMDLSQQVKEGDQVALSLIFLDKKNIRHILNITAPVHSGLE